MAEQEVPRLKINLPDGVASTGVLELNGKAIKCTGFDLSLRAEEGLAQLTLYMLPRHLEVFLGNCGIVTIVVAPEEKDGQEEVRNQDQAQ
jgi:hypothetical protein